MNFLEAVKAAQAGKKVCRMNLRNDIFLTNSNGEVYFNDNIYRYEFETEDLLAQDWEVVK